MPELDSGDKKVQIDRILRTLLESGDSFEETTIDDVRSSYPHLMPEIVRRFSDLKNISDAIRHSDDEDDHLASAQKFIAGELKDYDIIGRIGVGSQGAVYCALHKLSKRSVALKVLMSGPLANEQQRLRFRREIEIVSRLKHPNIVTLYECGFISVLPYYTMEHIQGLPITDHLLLAEPTVKQCVKLFIQVCTGLGHAHQKGVIHRDIKPTNILVGDDAVPHVVDFGLAKDISRSGVFESKPNQVVGTLPYLSPEEASDEEQGHDVRSDIYSLGVVMFESLSGEVFPYPVEGNRSDIKRNIIHKQPLSLLKAVELPESTNEYTRSDIGEDLACIVAKALEKDRNLRYQSMLELSDDLACYLEGHVVQARSGNRLYIWRKTLRKYRARAAITASFLAVLIGGLVGTTLAWQRAERMAEVFQAALVMAHYDKLGSAERDAGRIESAASLLENSVELGEYMSTDDPVVCRYLYSAYHRIAETYYHDGRSAKADPYCFAAVRLAERMASLRNNDPEWKRLLGFSLNLRGQMAYSEDAWEQAIGFFDQAETIREQLSVSHPDNLSLKSELAAVHGWQGQCCRKLRWFERALEHYKAEYNIRKELLSRESDSVDRIIEFVYAHTHLAAWHLSQKTTEDDQTASKWLKAAEALLREGEGSSGLSARRRDVDRLTDTINYNTRLIAKRARVLLGGADQVGSSSG